MSGKGFETGGKDEFDELDQRLSDLEHKAVQLANIKQPTIPLYPSFSTPNPGDLPDDPIEGQTAIGQDDDLHYHYSNGAWHQTGIANLPWAVSFCNLASTFTGFPSGNAANVSITADSITTNDPDTFKRFDQGPGADPRYVLAVDKPGMYYCKTSLHMYSQVESHPPPEWPLFLEMGWEETTPPFLHDSVLMQDDPAGVVDIKTGIKRWTISRTFAATEWILKAYTVFMSNGKGFFPDCSFGYYYLDPTFSASDAPNLRANRCHTIMYRLGDASAFDANAYNTIIGI
jgi:hypothetical protein